MHLEVLKMDEKQMNESLLAAFPELKQEFEKYVS